MAYGERHKLLTVYGTSWTPADEEWQFSLRLSPNTVETVSQAQADACYTLASALMSNVTFSMKSVHRFVGVKLAPIGTNGLYVPGEIAYTKEGSPVTGAGTGGEPWPPQCALAITLRSLIPRGRGSRGRFYLPGMQGTIGTDGRLGAGRPATILGPLVTFIQGLNGVTDLGQVQVMSKVGGERATVTSIECGNVVDTQRRRRRQLLEARVSAAI